MVALFRPSFPPSLASTRCGKSFVRSPTRNTSHERTNKSYCTFLTGTVHLVAILFRFAHKIAGKVLQSSKYSLLTPPTQIRAQAKLPYFLILRESMSSFSFLIDSNVLIQHFCQRLPEEHAGQVFLPLIFFCLNCSR